MCRPFEKIAAALTAPLGVVVMTAIPFRALAEVDLGGFVEAAYGARVSRSPVHDGELDFTIQETRAQLRLEALGQLGEAFARIDFVHDEVAADGTDLELREGFASFTTARDNLDVKAGRQILTWGTGDLLFINDLFPKDWESFFSGREDAYLKAPSNTLRLGFFALPLDVDLAITPEFTPDRLPQPGGRFSVAAPEGFAPPREPAQTLENVEWALRLARHGERLTLELYGYRGFYKAPEGLEDEGTALRPVHPELSVYGASLRLGGSVWLEAGWYDSREDRAGEDPLIPNSTLRLLLGVERELATDLRAGAQYFLEFDPDATSSPPAPSPLPQEELAHLLTLRLERLLRYQTIRLSAFAFVDPEHGEGYTRALASYALDDHLKLTLGANLFWEGDEEPSLFGRFGADDNIYLRVRYSF